MNDKQDDAQRGRGGTQGHRSADARSQTFRTRNTKRPAGGAGQKGRHSQNNRGNRPQPGSRHDPGFERPRNRTEPASPRLACGLSLQAWDRSRLVGPFVGPAGRPDATSSEAHVRLARRARRTRRPVPAHQQPSRSRSTRVRGRRSDPLRAALRGSLGELDRASGRSKTG